MDGEFFTSVSKTEPLYENHTYDKVANKKCFTNRLSCWYVIIERTAKRFF